MAKSQGSSIEFLLKICQKEILEIGGKRCCTFEDFSMSHIFQENVQIPIPYGTYVNPTTQQVFIKFRAERSFLAFIVQILTCNIFLNKRQYLAVLCKILARSERN